MGGFEGPCHRPLSPQRVLEGGQEQDEPLPAALVRPRSGQLRWFLDAAAAAALTVPVEKHDGDGDSDGDVRPVA